MSTLSESLSSGLPRSLEELQQQVAAVLPQAILVPQRLLRRIIKHDTHFLGFRVPHRKSYWIEGSRLKLLVEPDELSLPSVGLATHFLLVARPTQEELLADPIHALAKIWRLLFHAMIHQTLEHRLATGELTAASVSQRIAEIGKIEFAEISLVLQQEDLLIPPMNEVSIYCEFQAVYWELKYFCEPLLTSYFPGIENWSAVQQTLALDLDASELLRATRPQGASLLEPMGQASRPDLITVRKGNDDEQKVPAGEAYHWAAEADLARHVGNDVRAAICAERAAGRSHGSAASDAEKHLAHLAQRLQIAMGLPLAMRDRWLAALRPLIRPAIRGYWSPEKRLLHDLQKVCVDHERGVFRLNLWGWIRSWGKAPLRQPLPIQQLVMMCKHLRSARGRIGSLGVPRDIRIDLAELLDSSLDRIEHQLRGMLRPRLAAALDRVDLTPCCLPEQIARQKLIEELLDRTIERGLVTMSHLRDALSRNQLKFPDLARVSQLWQGDQLLKMDRELAESLDGVYRPGEIYLRVMQKLSSVAFGTPWGRLLVRYLAVPFGGAFILLAFMNYLGEEVFHLVPPGASVIPSEKWVIWGGLFFGGVLHVAGFRAICLEFCRLVGRTLHLFFIEGPQWLLRRPWLRQLLSSRFYRFFLQAVIKPLAVPGLLMLGWRLIAGRIPPLPSTLILWGLTTVILNTRMGRAADEAFIDWVAQSWHQLRIHVFTALFRQIVDGFQQLLEWLERLMYAVDEWLRFRSEENRFLTIGKALLAIVWLGVHYVLRFCVNVLVEPQINPIKHFPVVTVSHKILLPTAPAFATVLETALGFGKAEANTLAWTTIFCIPGIFGFLVWELKENWRLYASNRAAKLRPARVGHHGETMPQLLRLGFHSGRIPKLFAKLRRSTRKGLRTGVWKQTSLNRKAIHQTVHALQQFVERELIALLKQAHPDRWRELACERITLGCNRIDFELVCPTYHHSEFRFRISEQRGWLVAQTLGEGWLREVGTAMREEFELALRGFYKLSDVTIVQEQIEAALGPQRDYELTPDGLRIVGRGESSLVLTIDENPADPGNLEWAVAGYQPGQLLFKRQSFQWQDWVGWWRNEQAEPR